MPLSTSTSEPPKKTRRRNLTPAERAARDARRKVSHSAIERRRREKINDKIAHLRLMVPSSGLEQEGGAAGLHKMNVLQAAIDHIKDLRARLRGMGQWVESDGEDVVIGGAEVKREGSEESDVGSVEPDEGARVLLMLSSGVRVDTTMAQAPVVVGRTPSPTARSAMS
ncbi:hypothetical protein HK101_005101, partial [Irineochytrium annulatum]